MRVEEPVELPPTLLSEVGPYRTADYFAWPDEPRCELWKGHRVLTAAPRFDHQILAAMIYEVLTRYARSTGGRAVFSPIDVVLSDNTVVQPDVLVLTEKSLGKAGGRIDGPPDLAVEVISPREARRDRLFKLNLYLEAGVSEYWIVDGAERTIEFLVNRDGHFAVEPAGADGIYRSPTLAGLELDLARLWRAIEDPRAEP